MALKAGRVGVRPDQVDSTGKVIGAGGSGAGGKIVLDKTLLANSGAVGQTITLSEEYDKYNFLQIVATTLYNGVNYHLNSWYDTNDIVVGAGVGAWTDGNSINFTITDKKAMTLNLATLSSGTFKIYGVNLIITEEV